MPRAAGRESERAEFAPPLLVSDLQYSQWETVLEKALTISGADRFTRRGGTCRLHAIFMNQLCIIWGYQEELSSTAACPRAEDICSINSSASHFRRQNCAIASPAPSTVKPPRDNAEPVLPTPMRRRASNTEAPADRLPRCAIRPRPDELGVLGFEPAQPTERLLHRRDCGGGRRWEPHRLAVFGPPISELVHNRGHELK